jgi:hypothetical protein
VLESFDQRQAPNQERGSKPPSPLSELGDLELNLLEPLPVRTEPLQLFARAAPGNHPCTRLGGFESPEEMAMSAKMEPRLKGAVGWLSLEEMARAEIDQARGHGVSGLGLLEGIEDVIWRLSSTAPASIAVMTGHRLARHIDLSGSAVEAATPRSPQTLVIEALRLYKWGTLAGVELPQPTGTLTLSNGIVIQRRERHIVVFPDRVELKAKELGRFSDVIPLRSA